MQLFALNLAIPEKLGIGELAVPLPGPGEVLINVAAAAISFADTLMIRDMHQNKHDLPFAPGMEVAGTIAAAWGRCNRVIRGPAGDGARL